MESISEDEQSSSNLSKNNLILDKPKGKLISIGECSRFHLYILGATICQIISILILGGLKNDICLFGFSTVLNSYSNIIGIYTYIGYIIFSLIFKFISEKNERKASSEIERKSFLIHNELLLPRNYKNLYFKIFIVSFCFGFYSELLNLLYDLGFKLLNYWTFETIFAYLLIKKYFKFEIYSHHKCSVYFIVISVSIFLIIASLLPESSGEDGKLNSYQKVEKVLGSYYYSIIIILFFIFISFIFAFSRTYSKVLMQVKNLSRYSLILLIGINGLIIGLISSIIFYFLNSENNIFHYFKELNEKQKDYTFYLEIFLIYPIFIFSNFLQMNFEILIIFYLNPVYAFITNCLTSAFTKLIKYLSNSEAEFPHFLFSELSEVFAIIGYIIFAEIIELNCCGLSDNTKRNIKTKGENEFYELRNSIIDNIDEEDEVENENKP